jgi:hypothetical protein
MLTCSAWMTWKRSLATQVRPVRSLKWQSFVRVSKTALKQSMLWSQSFAHAVTEVTRFIDVEGPVRSVPGHTRYLIPSAPVKTSSVPGQALRACVKCKRVAAESTAKRLRTCILDTNSDNWPEERIAVLASTSYILVPAMVLYL